MRLLLRSMLFQIIEELEHLDGNVPVRRSWITPDWWAEVTRPRCAICFCRRTTPAFWTGGAAEELAGPHCDARSLYFRVAAHDAHRVRRVLRDLNTEEAMTTLPGSKLLKIVRVHLCPTHFFQAWNSPPRHRDHFEGGSDGPQPPWHNWRSTRRQPTFPRSTVGYPDRKLRDLAPANTLVEKLCFFACHILTSSPWLWPGRHQYSLPATIAWRAQRTRVTAAREADSLTLQKTAVEPLRVNVLRVRIKDGLR